MPAGGWFAARSCGGNRRTYLSKLRGLAKYRFFNVRNINNICKNNETNVDEININEITVKFKGTKLYRIKHSKLFDENSMDFKRNI